jgi:flavin reductase
MSRLSAAVTILTTDGPSGRHGITATAVCSVTDSPPTLIACLNRGSGTFAKYLENGALAVNVLAKQHERISGRFARPAADGAERFAHGEWTTLITGAPVLADALLAVDCRIVRTVEVGTHVVLFGEVVAVSAPTQSAALIYYDRTYQSPVPIIGPFDTSDLPIADDIMF